MKGLSLRLRLALAGGVAIVLALAVAGYGLTLLFERHVYRTLADTLNSYVREIAGGLEIDTSGEVTLPRPPDAPRFEAPLSGLYWEVIGGARALRSRSLWDVDLNLSGADLSEGQTHYHQVAGPDGKLLLVAERRILPLRGQARGVRIIVGSDLTRLKAARDAFVADLAPSLALLALVLGAATFVQLGLGLRPLKILSEEVSAISSGRRRRLSGDAPLEIRPLVAEVNALLNSRDAELERARGRAADLAHGLKTPLAALAGDAAQLRDLRQCEIANSIEAVGEAMRRHVERELARARMRGGARKAAHTQRRSLRLWTRSFGRWRAPTRARSSLSSTPRRRKQPRLSSVPTSPKSWGTSSTMRFAMPLPPCGSPASVAARTGPSQSRTTGRESHRNPNRSSVNAAAASISAAEPVSDWPLSRTSSTPTAGG